MLNLSTDQLQMICQHAQATYPEEGCGLLLGTIYQGAKTVREVWQTENDWTPEFAAELPGSLQPGSKRNRFRIAPEVMLHAQKVARERALKIIGIYHSHPNGQPIPSEFDRAIAWQEYSYLIVALTVKQDPQVRSWILNEQHTFEPEVISIDRGQETARCISNE